MSFYNTMLHYNRDMTPKELAQVPDLASRNNNRTMLKRALIEAEDDEFLRTLHWPSYNPAIKTDKEVFGRSFTDTPFGMIEQDGSWNIVANWFYKAFGGRDLIERFKKKRGKKRAV